MKCVCEHNQWQHYIILIHTWMYFHTHTDMQAGLLAGRQVGSNLALAFLWVTKACCFQSTSSPMVGPHAVQIDLSLPARARTHTHTQVNYSSWKLHDQWQGAVQPWTSFIALFMQLPLSRKKETVNSSDINVIDCDWTETSHWRAGLYK
jgi:hypothetical protein